MSDQDDVLAANDAFYQAFESLELAQMEAVWLRAPYIACVHPGWPLLAGWGPVMESWQRIFAGTLAMRFELGGVDVHVGESVAWVVCVENIESRERDGKTSGCVQATNVFERRDGRWFIVHHHGSPIFAEAGGSEPTQLQ